MTEKARADRIDAGGKTVASGELRMTFLRHSAKEDETSGVNSRETGGGIASAVTGAGFVSP